MGANRRHVMAAIATAALLALMPVLLAATWSRASSERIALGCGQTVTTSVTLMADLTACGNSGLTIGADGIVINLNGHTISGTGAWGIGDEAFSSVVIKNGTITGFQRGVNIEGGSATIQGLRISGATFDGIFASVSTVITGNVVYDTGAVGIFAGGCCHAGRSTITNNVVNGNRGDGIVVGTGETGTMVSGNRALSNADDGMRLRAAGATVSGNTANANGANGIVLQSLAVPPSKAQANKAYFNTKLGISIDPVDTDLGANRADGNGSQHQCENVVCS